MTEINITDLNINTSCGVPNIKQIWIRVNKDIDHYNISPHIHYKFEPEFFYRSGAVISDSEQARLDKLNNSIEFLVFYIQDSQYNPIKKGGAQLITAGTGSVFDSKRTRKGFKAKIEADKKLANLQAVKDITVEAMKSKEYIQIIDFVYPEIEDFHLGATVRTGMILDIDHRGTIQKTFPVKDYVVPNQILIPDGFSITFEEIYHRWI